MNEEIDSQNGQSIVHTRNGYLSSNRLVFKACACEVRDLKPSSVFVLSEGNSPSRRGGFHVHGLFLEDCSIWTVVVNQSHDSETRCPPFIFIPYCNIRKPLAICKCRWACSPIGLGKKRTGRIHSCAETSYDITSRALHLEANDPP